MAETQAQTLERFFSTLREAVRDSRTAETDGPLTVAEIYQDLVPYRVARTQIGFAMNADYEHALMRLLAGEGEFVRLDPAEAQRELRRALDQVNPDVTLYRKYGSCEVWLRRDESGPALAGDASAGGEEAAASGPSGAAAAAPEPSEAAPPRAAVSEAARPTAVPEAARPAAVPEAAPESTDSPPAAASRACSGCGESLPDGRRVRFCPYCGADQRAPCLECGEELDPDWTFCIACGRRVGSGA